MKVSSFEVEMREGIVAGVGNLGFLRWSTGKH